jgi:hypothetical protein
MWLLRIFNPVKLFYALTAAVGVAVAMSLPVILLLELDLSYWARLTVAIGIPVFSFFLWRQDRDTLCPTCTTTARPFASTCQKCHEGLPYSTTAQPRANPAHTVQFR